MVTKPRISKKNRVVVRNKMSKKTLTEIFEEAPDSYPESVLFQDGLIDYIEDIAWGEKPLKCSGKNRLNIDKILLSHSSQMEAIKPLVEYEKLNGKSSYRKLISNGIKLDTEVERILNI